MRYKKINNTLFEKNRSDFTEKMDDKSLAIFNSNDLMPKNADQEMSFKQNSDLFYLCGIDQEETVLMLVKVNNIITEHLFIRETNEHIKVWEGEKLSKKEASEIIAEEATKCGTHFVNHRWVGGTLTNWFTMKNRVSHLKKLKKKEKKGELNTLPKKDAVVLRRKRYKLEKSLGGLINMLKIPDIVIVVDPKQEATAIAECKKLGIKIFSILDTIHYHLILCWKTNLIYLML